MTAGALLTLRAVTRQFGGQILTTTEALQFLQRVVGEGAREYMEARLEQVDVSVLVQVAGGADGAFLRACAG